VPFVDIPLATLIVVLAAREAPRGWLSRLKSDFAVTWLLLAGTAVAAAVWSGFGHSGFRGLLGPYAVLARSYDGGAVFTWLRVHVADLGPMFAVIPVATLPLALGHGLRRNAPPTARALSAVTLAALTALLVEVAAFSSTPYGLHRIHERYLFYAAPLVFAMFALWTQSGCDTHIRLAIAAGVTALLPLLLPRHGIVVDGLDTPVLFALDFHPDSAGSHGAVAPIAVSAYLAAALVLARPRLRPALIVLLAAGLLIVDVRLHRAVADRANVLATRALGTASRSDANWIDRAIGSSKPVTALYVAPAASCPHAADDVARAQAIYQRTEFFNSRVVRVALIGPDPDAGVPQGRLRLAGGGHAPRPGNGPTRVRYVVADARIALVGRVTAREPATGLALWAVDGVIRPRRPSTLDALASAVCRP